MSDCPLKLSRFLRNLHCFCACCGGTIQDITDGSPKEAEEQEEEGRESNAEQGATAACFSKKTVLQPKRTRKFWRSDKASKGKLQNLPSKKKQGVNRKEVEKGLEEAYTLHKSVRRKFPRNRVYVAYKDQQFEGDLVDMSLEDTARNCTQTRGRNFTTVS